MKNSAELDGHLIAIFSQVKDPLEFSRVFAKQLGIKPTDVETLSRHVPGILNESFSEKQAEELTSAISALGIHVTAVRRAEIPDLRDAILVIHAQCNTDGLHAVNLQQNHEVLIPWSAVEMICVGEIPIVTAQTCPGTVENQISPSHDATRSAVEETPRNGLELWVTCQPPYPGLRVHHERMKRDYLGLRRSAWSRLDFRRFLNDLIRSATKALLTQSTHDFLRHRSHGKHHFKNLDELMRYATLYALLARQTSGKQFTVIPKQPESPGT